MKLFTIGDSISQGFMSLAAARTELSFSTLLARCLDVMPGTDDYPIPLWGAGGLPLNIENLLRVLQRKYGSDIRGPLEWPVALATINEYLDEVEDFYERRAETSRCRRRVTASSTPTWRSRGSRWRMPGWSRPHFA